MTNKKRICYPISRAPSHLFRGFRRPFRHPSRVEVEAESLYEAAVLAVTRFRTAPWGEQVGPGTVLDIEVRERSSKHSLSLQQVERWLGRVTTSPAEASKKAKLSLMLVQGTKAMR